MLLSCLPSALRSMFYAKTLPESMPASQMSFLEDPPACHEVTNERYKPTAITLQYI